MDWLTRERDLMSLGEAASTMAIFISVGNWCQDTWKVIVADSGSEVELIGWLLVGGKSREVGRVEGSICNFCRGQSRKRRHPTSHTPARF